MVKKTLLIAAMLLCVCWIGRAQEHDPKMDELVFNAQEEYLQTLKNFFENGEKLEGARYIDIDGPQFFIENSMVDKFLEDLKENDVINYKTVIRKLRNNYRLKDEYTNVVFKYEPSKSKPIVEPGELDKNNDPKEYYYTIFSQVNVAMSKDSLQSNARYEIGVTWLVKFKEKDGNIEYILRSDEDRTAKAIDSITATPIPYLVSERETMRRTAERMIREWYEGISAEMFADWQPIAEPSYDEDAEIEVALPDGRNFTVSNCPEIKVNVDPESHLDNVREAYPESIEAYYTVSPKFDIVIDANDFNKAELTCDLSDYSFTEPVTLEELVKMNGQRTRFFEDFVTKLESFVSSKDENLKAELEAMFADASETKTIEVSKVTLNGKESKVSRTAKDYLKRINGESLTIDMLDDSIGSQFETIEYIVLQEFRSPSYSDRTEKTIHLKYIDGEYRVEKITVVDNSTERL